MLGFAVSEASRQRAKSVKGIASGSQEILYALFISGKAYPLCCVLSAELQHLLLHALVAPVTLKRLSAQGGPWPTDMQPQ